MRWWLCLWWRRSSFAAFPSSAAEAATRRSRAHSSDKMAGRKGKGCKDRGGGMTLALNQASRFQKQNVKVLMGVVGELAGRQQ